MGPAQKIHAWMAALMIAGGLVLAAGSALAADRETFPCAEKVEGQIAAEAELAGLECHLGKYKGVDSLFVKVALKNRSPRAQRFRVHLFFDDGKAVGGLIPRKTRRGLIEPGETASYTYPVRGLAAKPQKLTVIVSTMAD